jgi:hypothetical protein
MGQGERELSGVDWERLARAETHPLRISIVEVLWMDGGRTLSPTELSHELQTNLSGVNYHVTCLFKDGILQRLHSRQASGAGVIEHFYCPLEHSGEDLFERLREKRIDPVHGVDPSCR